MSQFTRVELVTRETVLMLLTDAETAKVSTAEAAAGLSDGAEYLDLEHIDEGIQRAIASTKLTMGHVIPRSAVSDLTWTKILAQLTL